ncbi:hypothetical protein ACIGNX_22600 [Actinosynnema sp. NPDC053489]|uniref:hypothetical protein n=1 Tax=Actinosynnema sp. NPDC053489 TaxID=3363916 RepID=UPI0037C663C8
MQVGSGAAEPAPVRADLGRSCGPLPGLQLLDGDGGRGERMAAAGDTPDLRQHR